MNNRKLLKRILGALMAVTLALGVMLIRADAVTTRKITAETGSTVKQGESAQCAVFIDGLSPLAALDITVHFDKDKVRILDVENSVDCDLYDSARKESSIRFSYLFSGDGGNGKTELFRFDYQVLEDAAAGETYFDIIVEGAYDLSLKDVSVSGSRCKFTIEKKKVEQSCTVSGANAVSTAIDQEFTLTYRFSTPEIAAGNLEICYDPELLEVISVQTGAFFSGKDVKVHQKTPGVISVSFTGTAYGTAKTALTVHYRTIKNVSASSVITLAAKDLRNLDQEPIDCEGCSTAVTVIYDETYVGDAPKMEATAVYDAEKQQVTATIRLEAGSHLGAGDFVLEFDPAVLKLAEFKKGFSPDFFTVNTKNEEEGILKFSIISLKDIVTAETVLTVTFDVVPSYVERVARLDLIGSMLADALTDPIRLNVLGTEVMIPAMARPIRGDVNGDGVLDYMDAYLVMSYAVGLPTGEANLSLADVNGDGEIDYLDAYLIMRRSVDGVDQFPAEP